MRWLTSATTLVLLSRKEAQVNGENHRIRSSSHKGTKESERAQQRLMQETIGGGSRKLDDMGNADVLKDQVCMQDAAGFSLGCTANDVQLASARNINVTDKCNFPGDMVTFTADFEIVLTAQARHDIGIWFSQDGDPNEDGSLTGICTAVTPAYGPDLFLVDPDGTDPGFLDLDGTNDPYPGEKKASGIQDTCGDIDTNHNPLFQMITLTVTCIPDDSTPPILRLPYCTSWRQSGANDLCTSPLGAFPGSPSKCRCDTGFTVDILVPPAAAAATKTPNPDTIFEPGEHVTYTYTLSNTKPYPSYDVFMNITSLVDNMFGDITQIQGDISATNCETPTIIEAGDVYECAFTAYVAGDGGTVHRNTITAMVIDGNGNRENIDAFADVEIIAEPSSEPSSAPSATPSASPSSEPSSAPSATPSSTPSATPSSSPSSEPSSAPSATPSSAPSATPSVSPSSEPSSAPSATPSSSPSSQPSSAPSATPSASPSESPSAMPSCFPAKWICPNTTTYQCDTGFTIPEPSPPKYISDCGAPSIKMNCCTNSDEEGVYINRTWIIKNTEDGEGEEPPDVCDEIIRIDCNLTFVGFSTSLLE